MYQNDMQMVLDRYTALQEGFGVKLRHIVEMESLQFVGCSWFMGLIGLVFRFTQNKFTENRLCVRSRSSPVSSRLHLDAPGLITS